MLTRNYDLAVTQSTFTTFFGLGSQVVPWTLADDMVDELFSRKLEIEDLQRQLVHFTTNTETSAQLRTQLAAIHNEVEELRARNHDLEFDVRGRDHRIINHIDTITELKAQIEDHKIVNYSLSEKNDELNAQLSHIEEQELEKLKRIDELEGTLAEIARQRTPGANATVNRIVRLVERVLPHAA